LCVNNPTENGAARVLFTRNIPACCGGNFNLQGEVKMKMKKRLAALTAMLAMALALAACGGRTNPMDTDGPTIVSIGPANSEILIALGLGGNIVAADEQDVEGIPSDIAVINMMAVDLEHIMSLNPDYVVATGMIAFAGDPLLPLAGLDINVVYIDVPNSIDEVKASMMYLAGIFNVVSVGQANVDDMATEIAAIAATVDAIENRRTVYFEVSTWPATFGADTFLHEMLTIAGGINIFADLSGWPSPSLEDVVYRNPDVILTSTNYIADPAGEIMNRAGFAATAAVQAGNVHIICTDTSNRPSHHVVAAIRQIAEAIYPEYFR